MIAHSRRVQLLSPVSGLFVGRRGDEGVRHEQWITDAASPPVREHTTWPDFPARRPSS